MTVQIACQCGKRYRAPDDVRGKPLRCKECGESLYVPPKKSTVAFPDEELDLAEQDAGDAFGEGSQPDSLPPSVHQPNRTRFGAGGSTGEVISFSDLVVRFVGFATFLVTVANCIYQFQTVPIEQDPPRHGQLMNYFMWGILPIFIGGLLGIYIAIVGEEPDPVARRTNRKAGLIKCGIGVGMIVLGVVLTFLVSAVLNQIAPMAMMFTGLVIGGAFVIAYGGLSVLTGREFTMRDES